MKYMLIFLIFALVACSNSGFATTKHDHAEQNDVEDKCFLQLQKHQKVIPEEFPRHVYYHNDMRPDFISALDVAVDSWNESFGFKFFDITPVDEFDDVTTGVCGWITLEEEDLQHNQAGWASWGKCKAIVKIDRVQRFDSTGKFLAYSVLKHELGHTLGLTHVDDETNLMYKDTLVASQFDELNEVQKCFIESLIANSQN